MSDTGIFTLDIIQKDHWRPGAAEIQAMIRVSARPGAEPGPGLASAGAAEIIIVDCSGSMGNPPAKLRAAKRAVHAALEAMRDGTEFAILSGRGDAEVVYPRAHGHGLAGATPRTRDAAKDAVDQLYPADGTMISSWLRKAKQLLEPYPGHVRHATLLTDGKNEHESQDGTLDQVLGLCRGVFTCDARGIGDQWDPRDLRKIVSALHGRADGLPDAVGLADDFRAVMRDAMRKTVPSIALRIRTRDGVVVSGMRQLYPAVADLTGHGIPVGPNAADYWIGSWGEEIRDYLVKLAVNPEDFADEDRPRLAGVEVAVPGPAGTASLARPGFIIAYRASDDPPMRTMLPVDGYVSQMAADDHLTAGCHAWYAGDFGQAEAEWGEAARLASAAHDAERLRVLESLVHIVHAVAGRVRLRDDLSRAVVMRAETRAAVSTFMPGQGLDAEVGPGARAVGSRTCPACGRRSPPGARFCERCAHPLDAGGPGREAAER
jgi:hypothetical protein